MDILALSNYVVRRFSQQSPDGITPMKLQKLLYYIKVWTLVAEQELVTESFEHWDYGPVNRKVYDFYKNLGKSEINPPNKLDDVYINESEQKLVDFIVENYIKFDAFTLSTMTHKEKPWRETPRNDTIQNDLIKSYYREQPFANNFQPFDLSNDFYPLNNQSFTIDMTEEDALEITKYSSYEEYKRDSSAAENDFNKEWLGLVMN